MNLGRKIFLTTVLVVVVVLGGSLWLTRREANQAADESINRALTATRSSIEGTLESNNNALHSAASRLAQVPAYLARIEEALRTDNRSDLLDQADEFRQQLNADWTLITDRLGELKAWTLYPGFSGEDMGAGSLIGMALEGAVTEGTWIEPEEDGSETIYQAVGVPLLDPAGMFNLGSLVAARAVDSTFLAELKRNTDSDIVLFTLDPDAGTPVPAIGTIPTTGLIAALRGVDFGDRESGAGDTTRVVLATADETLIGALGTLVTASGAPVGGYVGLRSRDAELASYNRLQRTVVIAFAGGIVLSMLTTLVLTRQITRPVTALVEATRRLAEGSYEGDIPVVSNDEIGELTEAFGKLSRELKEKDELLEYLRFTDDAATIRMDVADLERVSTTSNITSQLPAGAEFAGRYRITQVLGTGGMGVVYRAHDLQLDEPVAIKTLRAEVMDETMLERFKQEIKLARRITHRNVVRTHDLGELDGVYYITMELVEGTTLNELIKRRGKLPVGVTLTVARQLLRALEVAHDQGIVHRDIKPPNVIVDAGGFLKVMDFGIATLAEAKSVPGERITGHGNIVGTPQYMSPEQLMGDAVDARTDIYAVGAVLYECLTGQLMFEAENLPTLIMMHMDHVPTRASEVEPTVPREICDILGKAVAKDPNERWQSAAEFSRAFDEVTDGSEHGARKRSSGSFTS